MRGVKHKASINCVHVDAQTNQTGAYFHHSSFFYSILQAQRSTYPKTSSRNSIDWDLPSIAGRVGSNNVNGIKVQKTFCRKSDLIEFYGGSGPQKLLK